MLGRRLTVTVLTLAVLAGVTACGGGDGDDEAIAATTTVSERTRINDYCERVLRLESVREPEAAADATEDEQREKAREAGREALPLMQDAADAAPAEIQADANTMLDARKALARTGDPGVFNDPAVRAAEERAHAFDLRNCPWGDAEIQAVEYAFRGVPASFRRRPTSFDLSNEGSERHELVVLKIRADVQEPAAEILAGDPETARQKLNVAGRTVALPGETAYKVVNLEAGRYVVACFLTVGGRADAPSHVARGMFAEFNVD